MPLTTSGAQVGLRQQFFAASGTFTVPAGVSQVLVTMISSCSADGSFAGKMHYKVPVAVTPGQSISVTVSTAAATAVASVFGALSTATGVAGGFISSGNVQGMSSPFPRYGLNDGGAGGAVLVEW